MPRDMTWPEFNDQQWGLLEPSMRTKAAQIVRDYLGEGGVKTLKDAYDKDPETWWAVGGWHNLGGMNVRNALRDGGILDKDLPDNPLVGENSGNWDDFYLPVVEAAIGAREV